MASFSHRKNFKLWQKITFIVLLCIASQFSCVTNIAEVIDAIAIYFFQSLNLQKVVFWIVII